MLSTFENYIELLIDEPLTDKFDDYEILRMQRGNRGLNQYIIYD